MNRKELSIDVNTLLHLRHSYEKETRSLWKIDRMYNAVVRKYRKDLRKAHLIPHRITIDAYDKAWVLKEMDRNLMAFFSLSMSADWDDIDGRTTHTTAEISHLQVSF